MIQFVREEPQQGHRNVDFAVSLTEPLLIEAKQFSIYEPLLLLEGKRLPPPSKDREKEYVTGFAKKSGGIQRFKLGLYAACHEVAGIIGFMQEGTAQQWHTQINSWIEQLSQQPLGDPCRWHERDKLGKMTEDAVKGMASCRSAHKRTNETETRTIELYHLWVKMSNR